MDVLASQPWVGGEAIGHILRWGNVSDLACELAPSFWDLLYDDWRGEPEPEAAPGDDNPPAGSDR